MTKPLDAAVRAAKEAIEDPKRYAKYEDVARCIMCASLPAEPTAEAMEAMALAGAKTPGMTAIDSALTVAAIHGCTLPKEYGEPGNSPMSIAVRAAYRALRAHLLGEDA